MNTNETEYKRVDAKDVQYLNIIKENDGIRQFELAKKVGDPDSKVKNRLDTLERIQLVKIVRGRRNKQCYIGSFYTEFFKKYWPCAMATDGGAF